MKRTINKLIQVLCISKELDDIFCSKQEILEHVFGIIIEYMHGLCDLISLDLKRDAIVTSSYQRLTEILTATSHKSFDIINAGLGNRGVTIIADCVKEAEVKELRLSSNGISNPGAFAIAEALVGNKTLKKLMLDCNRIQYKGAMAIVKALMENNTTLMTFNMSFNCLSNSERAKVRQLLKNHRSLKHFHV